MKICSWKAYRTLLDVQICNVPVAVVIYNMAAVTSSEKRKPGADQFCS